MSDQAQPKGEKPTQPAAEDTKISPAELKKRAKAEKQARRAAQKEQTGGPAAAEPSTNGATEGGQEEHELKQKGGQQQKGQQQKSRQRHGQKPAQDSRPERPGQSSSSTMPPRRRPSQSNTTTSKPTLQPKKEKREIELFSHLTTHPRLHTAGTTASISKDIHPAVLALGYQYSTYTICGSSARCIEYLKSCRPLAESMGNAIRWLKKLIAEIDPAMPEHEAKDFLGEEIGRFVRERVVVSGKAIAATASKQIKRGSVVLTYAKSSIVEKTILQAWEQGTEFRVIVVDSRPLFEGRKLAESLIQAAPGLELEYLPFSGLAHAVRDATLVLLGAHSMLSNGRLLSRVGTASVAMQAQRRNVPVIVLCESVKFSGKVALDSIVLNEVAPAEELLLPFPASSAAAAGPSAMTSTTTKDDDDDEAPKLKHLKDWKEIPNLQVLNLMYDVTPAEYIRMVICEYGSVPPSSVPVVHGMANAMEV
ncbi:hypothetical protein LTR78_000515 [Recurvomyces mirabilis]|uniref:Translation initiation factor eIF2B subunit delta n=1 Tax=Recurvomyces mirabilis TaxID=574656 RepID=A0AAE0WY43_9PEZI|nr:hypothetical protein LTR78_000515 [Recurvomyces mirabilis]KAK5162170.1 hypothetical protein LTS14_000516 [Recurvomyces mirabilis]